MEQMTKFSVLVLIASFISAGCAPAIPPLSSAPGTATDFVAGAALTPSPVPTITATTPPAQPRLAPTVLGLDQAQFPFGVNPLTGLRVQDASRLDLPAVLVSISNMPVTARPQAGTGFAPWIFELFIGTGTTRFMGVFYGDAPRRLPNVAGSCAVRTQPFIPTHSWAGNRIWLDENRDGRQDPWETGIGGICVDLYNATSGELLQNTSSDANGYYAFNIAADTGYSIQFSIPPAYRFTLANLGNDDEDSDADPSNGYTGSFTLSSPDSSLDAGLVLTGSTTPTYSPADIAPERTYVGPIRSGRLTYNDFYSMFPASCLVYASAGEGIRQLLNGCEIIYGEHPDESPNTALLDTSRMLELAQRSKIARQPVNYSGNLFSDIPPTGGLSAGSLWTFYHSYTQTLWQYDPVSETYLRQTDNADGKGVFHPDSDRLSGRPLAFENVIVILADYQVVRHLQYDVNLRYGLEGYAYLFRDGQLYKIRWSTANRDWEKQTGLLRPIHFIGTDKQPFPLKPGRTWISIMTLNSIVRDLGEDKWQALFAMPDDEPPVP
jgi:hypothetical protein